VTFDLILLGFGNVARRFVTLVHERRRALARDHGFDVRVVSVITRRHGAIHDIDGLNARALAASVAGGGTLGVAGAAPIAELRKALAAGRRAAREGRLVVIETTTLDVERGEPATTHVRTALAAGAHVVTANKGPAAFAWKTLDRRAARAGRRFLFEGAVMDGVPVFALVRETLPAVTITGIRGVVNTTTNFILSAMEQGQAFEAALAEMQRAGIAEADPTLDVDGWDAAAKTAALANVLLGAGITARDVDRTGIRGITAERIRKALAAGARVKLVASAARTAEGVAASVRPVDLPERDLLAQLGPDENAIVLATDLLGEMAVVQRGSGLVQTAYALLADLTTIARGPHEGRRRPAPRSARRDRTRGRRDRR
jgi:homoserine dehydrogenase